MALLMLPWWPLWPWLSPAAAWFIFFNAVVGAIAVMSSSAQPGQGGGGATSSSPRRLCRSGSLSMVLDRLLSFSIFSVHPAVGGVTGPPLDDGSADPDPHCYYCCSRQAEDAPATKVLRGPGPLAVAAATAAETATSGCAPPSAPVEMAKGEDHAARAPSPAYEGGNKAEAEEVLQDESICLDEAYALAQRHRAAQPLASPPPPAPAPATAATTPTSPARRKNQNKPVKVAEGIRRRRAQGCGGAEAEEALEGKAELNARADLFIRQFREDLKLQRLNSILRHTQPLGSPTAAR